MSTCEFPITFFNSEEISIKGELSPSFRVLSKVFSAEKVLRYPIKPSTLVDLIISKFNLKELTD